MYQDKFVIAVRDAVTNEVFREVDGAVLLNFGKEYKIQLKNLNSRRAVVGITIDSSDVLNGQRLIIEPNESTEVQGYLDTSGHVTHRFKFIEKTAQISKHRGDKVDDGMIRIEFQFEAEKPEVKYSTTYHYDYRYGWGNWWFPPYQSRPIWVSSNAPSGITQTFGTTMRGDNNTVPICAGGGPMGGGTGDAPPGDSLYSCNHIPEGKMRDWGGKSHKSHTKGVTGSSVSMHDEGVDEIKMKSMNFTRETETKTSGGILRGCEAHAPKSLKDGITVKGGSSDQRFVYGAVGKLEVNKHVMVLNIRGYSPTSGEPLKVAVEVKKKSQCSSCGRHCKSSMKFCPDCGTAIY